MQTGVTETYTGGYSNELYNDRADNKSFGHEREPEFQAHNGERFQSITAPAPIPHFPQIRSTQIASEDTTRSDPMTFHEDFINPRLKDPDMALDNLAAH